MKSFYHLNFDFNPIKHDFVFPNPKSYGWDIYVLEPRDIVTDECIRFFESIGLELYNCHLFRGARGLACGIHVDGHEDSKPIWAINWIIGSKFSEMIWYKIINDGAETFTNVGTAYKTFNPNDVSPIESLKFNEANNGPVLVRTDIPHRVINNDITNTRWCFSIRAKKIFKEWNDVVDFFGPYINDKN